MYKYTYNVEILPIPVIAALVTLVVRFDSIDILKRSISAKFKLYAATQDSSDMDQQLKHSGLWTLATADYIVPAVFTCPRNFMAHLRHMAPTTLAWHQHSHKLNSQVRQTFQLIVILTWDWDR